MKPSYLNDKQYPSKMKQFLTKIFLFLGEIKSNLQENAICFSQ